MILGNFDGLHLAHMSVIKKGMEYAAKKSLKSGVLLFENNTKGASLITSNSQKLKLLEEINPDFVYVKKFTREFMQKSPEEFICMLRNELNMKAVCVGYDYRFGHMASGDISTLNELSEKYGFDVIVTDEVKMDGKTVSSTHIRSLIEQGDMEGAMRFLGRYFTLSGKVEMGFQNGRKLGFPTANLCVQDDVLLPKNGVYAGYTLIDNEKYKSVINVGNNPTFGAEKITVESHILDFTGDIYGREISISFVSRMRGDIKFENIEALKEQIEKDTEKARNIL